VVDDVAGIINPSPPDVIVVVDRVRGPGMYTLATSYDGSLLEKRDCTMWWMTWRALALSQSDKIWRIDLQGDHDSCHPVGLRMTLKS
jgi:hypothetical protein